MATASMHARRRHHAATEAGLWLVWIIARITGLAILARRTPRLIHDLVDSDAAHRAHTAWTQLRTAAGHTAHRVALRAELAAADILTGPAPELLDLARARLRRRVGWLLLVGGALINLLYLALR